MTWRRGVRRAAAGAAAVAVILPLGSCSSSPEDEPIEFWNLLSGDDGQYMQQIVDEYNATDPEIPVAFQPAPREDMYMRMYSVARAADDIPDLVLVHNLAIAELASNEILTPVEPLMEHQPELSEENYLEAAWEAGQYDGAQWGIPLDLHGIITYYNEDLLAEHGLDEMLDDGVITVDDVLELEGQLPEDVYAMTAFFLPNLVYGWQYNISDGVGETAEDIDFDAPGYRESFEALVELEEAGLIAPEDADGAQVFRSGRSLLHPAGTWEISGHEEIDELSFGVAHALQLDESDPVNFFESHSFVQMNDEDREPERDQAVADFLEFVRTNSLGWAEAGQVVASRDTYDGDAYGEYPQSYFTEAENEDLLVTDNFEYAPYVSEAIGDQTANVTFGRHSIDEAIDLMNADTEARIEMVEAP